MSNDESDDRYNQWIDELSGQLYPEHRERAISELMTQSFQRFYLANPRVSESPTRLLTEARHLLSEHSSAALVFAAASIEVAIKETVLRPLLSGIVFNESIAKLVAGLLIDRKSSLDRLRELIFPVLLEYAGLDLLSFKRQRSAKPLWEEMQVAQGRRDSILHGGTVASHAESQTAIDASATLLEILFPSVLENLGLHLHETLICGEPEHVAVRPETIKQMSDDDLFAYLTKLREARSNAPILRRRNSEA